MSRIRLFKSSTVYPRYPAAFLASRPELIGVGYSQQIRSFLQDGFSFGDAWKHYLEATGQFEVMEVVLNAESIQRQWAKENGVRCSAQNWIEEILAAQLGEFKPQVWFCHSWITAQQRVRLRRGCPSIRYVIGYDGALNHDVSHFEGCDAVLSCVRASADFYTKSGFQGHWMPWGFDPRVLGRLRVGQTRHDLAFSGSVAMQKPVAHFGRLRLLSRLQREFELSVFSGDLSGWKAERLLLSHLFRGHYDLAGQVLRAYPSVVRLRGLNHGERFGLEMLQTLADSLVTLNIHGDAVRTAANIRLFEATGVGSCLLTDWKEDLPAAFEPDREVVAFRNHEECAEKVRYLLEHKHERESIAAAGQRRCLRDHHIGNHLLHFADTVLRNVG